MSEPLFSSSRTKIKRAEKFIRELEGLLTAYHDSKPYTAKINTAHNPPTVNITWTAICGHPEAVIGDCIHNLRTALDLMACDLVRAVNGNDNRVYFPFAAKAEEFDKVLKEKNFHRAGDDAVALVKQYQPYRGGNTLLRAMHDLDIEDKHKALVVVQTTRNLSIEGAYYVDNPELGNFSVTAEGVDLLFPADGEILPSVNVIQSLKDIVELVTSILEAFASLIELRNTSP